MLVSGKELSPMLRELTAEQCRLLLKALSTTLGSLVAQEGQQEKTIHQPLRNHITTKEQNTTLFMPASDSSCTGIKVVTVPSRGGPIEGAITIFAPEGQLIGMLSAAEITAFRTALATMTLFTRCTTLQKRRIVVFGSGKQAEWHLRLALKLAPQDIEKITVINRGRQRLEQVDENVLSPLRRSHPAVTMKSLAKEGTPDFDTQLRSELAESDVIFCCTPSTEPLFPNAYIQPRPGQVPKQRFISLIGSYKPHMQEIDSETLLSGGKVWVDSKEACLEESGELIRAKVEPHQLLEVGELFYPGKEVEQVNVPEGSNVVFKCVGMGVMDLVVGKTLLGIARELGIGTPIEGF
jgi:ornithine cyclodeaminase/alanine dehydrogenase-like protein (mu-crystallin family)